MDFAILGLLCKFVKLGSQAQEGVFRFKAQTWRFLVVFAATSPRIAKAWLYKDLQITETGHVVLLVQKEVRFSC